MTSRTRSRWEAILDQKPIPLIDHLLTEAAAILADDFRRWPLPVDEVDPSAGREVALLLAPDTPPPAALCYPEAVRLTRWEVERDLLAFDDYMRNRRYLASGLSESDRPYLLLLSRWLLEQLLALGEATHGKVNRARMGQVLDLLRARL